MSNIMAPVPFSKSNPHPASGLPVLNLNIGETFKAKADPGRQVIDEPKSLGFRAGFKTVCSRFTPDGKAARQRKTQTREKKSLAVAPSETTHASTNALKPAALPLKPEPSKLQTLSKDAETNVLIFDMLLSSFIHFLATQDIQTAQDGSVSDNGGNVGGCDSNLNQPSSDYFANRSPIHNGRRGQHNNSGDEQDNQGPRRSDQQNGGREGLMACPYYLMDPERYYRCMGRFGLRRFGDVKQHMQRCHTLVSCWCSFCFLDGMSDQGLQDHIDDCPGVANPWPEKLYPDELEELRMPRGLSDEQKWRFMWDRIFSGHPQPPSVYVQDLAAEAHSMSGRRLHAFLPGHFPRLLETYPVSQHILSCLMHEFIAIHRDAPHLARHTQLRRALNLPLPNSHDAQELPMSNAQELPILSARERGHPENLILPSSSGAHSNHQQEEHSELPDNGGIPFLSTLERPAIVYHQQMPDLLANEGSFLANDQHYGQQDDENMDDMNKFINFDQEPHPDGI
jgi:hypothetical protein